MTMHESERIPNLTGCQQMNILIIDDEKAAATGLQQVLRLEGYEADFVLSGGAAIRTLQKQHYDIALLDLHMPEMDGAEVLAHITSNHPQTSVIIVSGESELRKAVDVLKSGAKDFIRKPYTPEELVFSIENVAEKIRLENDNRNMLATLEESEALHRFIVHNSPDFLYMLDSSGAFTFVNKNTLKQLGYQKSDIIGQHYTKIIHPDDMALARHYFDNIEFRQQHDKLELRLRCKNPGNNLFVEVRAINVERKITGGYKLGRIGRGERAFSGMFGVARDITEKKRIEELIRYQQNHDPLTGLPNRILLHERLTQHIRRAEAADESFAVLLVDINRFKLINDTYSQHIGDKLLQQFVHLLRRHAVPGEIMARLGGDEFIIIMPAKNPKKAAKTRSEHIVADCVPPFHQDGQEIHISASIGIVTYPDHGTTAEALLKNVDTAVCNAKSLSTYPHCLYQPSLENRNSQKVFTENLIRSALREDRLLVYYQPLIDLQTMQIRSVEALCRIRSADGEIIPPGRYIDVAEETSLISDIGRAVLKRVCQDMTEWNLRGVRLPVAINVSAIQIQREDFTAEVLGGIRRARLRPQDFILELTENVLVQNMQIAIANIMDLADCGVKIAIDDFGIGYSSLSYLDHLPLNTLKLDKSFIQKITEHNPSETIVPAMIRVAEGLQLNFVAEGVETRQQHEYLLRHGGTIGQGYFYSYPLTRQQLSEFICRQPPHKQQAPNILSPVVAISQR